MANQMLKDTDDRLKFVVFVINEFHLAAQVKAVQAFYLAAFTEYLIDASRILLTFFCKEIANEGQPF